MRRATFFARSVGDASSFGFSGPLVESAGDSADFRLGLGFGFERWQRAWHPLGPLAARRTKQKIGASRCNELEKLDGLPRIHHGFSVDEHLAVQPLGDDGILAEFD